MFGSVTAGRARNAGGPCTGTGAESTGSIHHRGGRGNWWSNLASALLVLCGDGVRGCHGWVTANPKKAKEQGFSVNRLGIVHPSQIPVQHARYGLTYLTDRGTVSKQPPEEVEQ